MSDFPSYWEKNIGEAQVGHVHGLSSALNVQTFYHQPNPQNDNNLLYPFVRPSTSNNMFNRSYYKLLRSAWCR